MLQRIFVLVAMVSFSAVCLAENPKDRQQKTILGFLKPGMKISVSTVTGSTNVYLRVYEKQEYESALNFYKQSLNSIKRAVDAAKTDEVLSKHFEKFCKAREIDESERNMVLVASHVKSSYGTLKEVGADYIVCELIQDAPSGDRIIPKSQIARIQLKSSPVKFIVNARNGMRVDN